MSKISLDPSELRNYANRIQSASRRLASVDSAIMGLTASTTTFVPLKSMQFAQAVLSLGLCAVYLNSTADDFEKVEKKLLRSDPLNFSSAYLPFFGSLSIPGVFEQAGSWFEELCNDVAKSASFGSAVSALCNTLFTKKTEDGDEISLFGGFFKGKYTAEYEPSFGYKNKKAFEKYKWGKNLNKDQKDIPIKQINEDNPWYKDPRATIFEAKFSDKAEVSAFSKNASGEGKYASGEGEIKVLTGEAHGELAFGMYEYTKDKNGELKRVFSPGVNAEVGISAAAFSASGEGRIGLPMGDSDANLIGGYAKGDVKVLSGEANAKLAVNLKEVFLGASAEANVAEIEGSVGVTVLGVDAGVSGSLKVGVGAHANVGFTDGKLKVDVGAAIGVGFDVGFELDVGGAVDAVCGTAESVWEGGKKAFETGVKAIGDGAKAIGDGAKNFFGRLF